MLFWISSVILYSRLLCSNAQTSPKIFYIDFCSKMIIRFSEMAGKSPKFRRKYCDGGVKALEIPLM